MRFKIDFFVLALLSSIFVAYIYPDLILLGDGRLLGRITEIGVSLIFFFYGLKLSIPEIKSGLKNWRLHLIIQLCTFVVFPLVILLLLPLVHTDLQRHYWLSFFFLAALPSTVSSSVVLVSIARGNIPAAIFNASISGLIGVVITPLWMALFMSFDSENSFTHVYMGLLIEIVLPVILGLFLQKYWGVWARRYSKTLSNFDKSIILLIVYASFADSFVSGIFENVGRTYILYVFIGSTVLFFAIYWIIDYLCKHIFKFNKEDTITAVFCGSKKSLTHGSVFGKFIFNNNPNVGLYYLPLMIFHALQIFIITFIAQTYVRKQ